MKWFKIILIVLSLVCCKENEQLKDYSFLRVPKSLYSYIEIYHVLNGKYPDGLDELKTLYLNGKSDSSQWDLFIQNQWIYEKPDPSRDKQIILRHKKFSIYLWVIFKDGVIIEHRTIDNLGYIEYKK